MCFAPQRRALFPHRNLQKWSERGVLCTFWLGNVLRATTAYTFSTSQLPKVVWTWCALYILTWKCASRNVLRDTTACTFSTSQLPKVVRRWGVLYILTWKCASRHNGMHFFDIATSKSGPTLRCFVHFDLDVCFAPSLIWPAGSAPAALASPLFDPPEPQITGKTHRFATFLPFRAPASSSSSDSFPSLIFFLLPFSSLTLPTSAFPPVHIVGSLTSKLPSFIYILYIYILYIYIYYYIYIHFDIHIYIYPWYFILSV